MSTQHNDQKKAREEAHFNILQTKAMIMEAKMQIIKMKASALKARVQALKNMALIAQINTDY